MPKEKEAKIYDTPLDAAVAQVNDQFGAGSVMRWGEKPNIDLEVVSSGSVALNTALGVGGYPRGRIIEIYGPESSGKSTLAMHAAAEMQKLGGIVAYIDAEHAMDPVYARAIGVNVDDLLLSQPNSGEEALQIADVLTRSGGLGMFIIDSVAALVPKSELDGDMGDANVGKHARLMSQAMRKLAGGIYKTNTVAIFINQIREKIGVMFGSPEVVTGGRALKFYSSVRLDIRRFETIKDGGESTGNKTRVKVVKNKVAPPFKQAEFDIEFGVGISKEGDVIDTALDQGILIKGGTWLNYHGQQLGQGREKAKSFLKENPQIMKEIVDELTKFDDEKPADIFEED